MPCRVAQINITSPRSPGFLPWLIVWRAGCWTAPVRVDKAVPFGSDILSLCKSCKPCVESIRWHEITLPECRPKAAWYVLFIFFAEHCIKPWGLNRAVACLLDLYNHVCQILADIKMLSTRVNTAPFIEKCHFRFSPTCELVCRERFISMAGLQWASPPEQSRQMCSLYLHLLEGFHGISLN